MVVFVLQRQKGYWNKVLHKFECMGTNLRILQQIKGIHTGYEVSLRQFIEAIWFMVRSGCQ